MISGEMLLLGAAIRLSLKKAALCIALVRLSVYPALPLTHKMCRKLTVVWNVSHVVYHTILRISCSSLSFS